MDLNNLVIYGRIVRDAEMKVTKNDKKIVSFSVANNRSRKNSEGEFEQFAYFFPITLFGDYGEKLFKYLTKGQKVIIEGYLRQEKWEKDGKYYENLAIGVNNLSIIFDSQKKTEEQKERTEYQEEEETSSEMTEELYTDFDAMDPTLYITDTEEKIYWWIKVLL